MDISLASLVAALILAMAYVAGGWLTAHGGEEGIRACRRWISAAAGVSVAYVFVDVLPELAAQNRAVVAAAGGERTLFAEQRIYVLALLSFVILYGIQYFVLASRERRPHGETTAALDSTYLLHLAGYSAYSVLIGHLLTERSERGAVTLTIYTVAMALHFLIVDHSLFEEHGARYAGTGRALMAASVVAGWLIGAATHISPVTFARLFAILAGGVVITSLRAELPNQRQGRFWYFVLGAVLFAAILLFA